MRNTAADRASLGGPGGHRQADPLILFYTRYFRGPVDLDQIGCDGKGSWTNDRRRLAEADAVVFHIPNLRDMGDARKYPGQLWVAWSNESRENYPAIADPAFLKHFDLTMTHEPAADVWAPYLPDPEWWRETLERELQRKIQPAPVALFQSSAINLSGREDFVAELARHVRIDSYGRFMNNRKIEGPDRGPDTKIAIIGSYRFCLGLENSILPDYVTEKMFDPLRAGSVPVYFGAPNAGEFVPEHSYIDAMAYGGAKGLAEYLDHLVRTPAEYEAYFAWRSKPLPDDLAARIRRLEKPGFCRLMDLVARRMEERGPRPAGYPSLPFGLKSFVKMRLRRWRRWRRGQGF